MISYYIYNNKVQDANFQLPSKLVKILCLVAFHNSTCIKSNATRVTYKIFINSNHVLKFTYKVFINKEIYSSIRIQMVSTHKRYSDFLLYVIQSGFINTISNIIRKLIYQKNKNKINSKKNIHCMCTSFMYRACSANWLLTKICH
jgi:hypothetical protein